MDTLLESDNRSGVNELFTFPSGGNEQERQVACFSQGNIISLGELVVRSPFQLVTKLHVRLGQHKMQLLSDLLRFLSCGRDFNCQGSLDFHG